jgi:hypothetical protein
VLALSFQTATSHPHLSGLRSLEDPTSRWKVPQIRFGVGWTLTDSRSGETVNRWWPSAYQNLPVVGRDARNGITGEPPLRVGFPGDYEWRDQVYEAVASEC